MNKKTFIYIVIGIFLFVVIIGFMTSSDEVVEASTEDYEYSYYVEANDNVFVKLSNVCDDCCYYVVDMILGGIESIFNSLTKS